ALSGKDGCFVLPANWEWGLFVVISAKKPHVLVGARRWAGKVVTSSICLSLNGRMSERANTNPPIGFPSRNKGTASTVRKPVLSWASVHVYSVSAKTSGT